MHVISSRFFYRVNDTSLRIALRREYNFPKNWLSLSRERKIKDYNVYVHIQGVQKITIPIIN